MNTNAKLIAKLIAVLSLLPLMAQAQAGFDSDVDAELDQLYAAPAQSKRVQVPTQQAVPAVNSGQPIYILNQAPATSTQTATATQLQSAQQVQKQPTTFIESTPLSESNAERMRKARQEAELGTETKIVEKLEQSRMEDEKQRAEALFGDRFNRAKQQNEAVVAAPVEVVPQQPVPVQVIQAPPSENTRDIIREELQSAMKTEAEVPQQATEQKYFAGLVGVGEYPDVSNVTGNYALGFTFGTKYENSYALEGSFIYSNYTLKNAYSSYGYGGYPYSYYPTSQDVNQYAGSIAAKYFLFNGMVKPVLGGLIQYSHRTYTADGSNNYGGSYQPNREVNSQAIDLGAIVGADIEFSPKTSLGVDMRYMFNLSSRNNSNNAYVPPGTTALEKLNYYVLSVTGKVNF